MRVGQLPVLLHQIANRLVVARRSRSQILRRGKDVACEASDAAASLPFKDYPPVSVSSDGLRCVSVGARINDDVTTPIDSYTRGCAWNPADPSGGERTTKGRSKDCLLDLLS